MGPEPLLKPAEAHFVQGGVSISVAARTADLSPVMARALGCRVTPDRREITIFLSRSIAASVLECLEDNGAIAVVFTLPSTHQTLKLKATDARLLEIDPADLGLIQDYRRKFALDLASMGHTPEFAAAVVPMMDDLVAVRFTPSAAFDQTPGPAAGKALGA
jgi:hypothetical protein